ncbi:MAG: sensor protein lytS [Pedobacter sp.]|nr:MAG: sensor protein lytS [Pedobacter sp.]
MFAHRYRYLFVLGLSIYTLLNTLLCEVYFYFRIDVPWYLALLTITGITLLIWEGNRILEPLIRKVIRADLHKVRFTIYFFLAGNIVATFATILMVWITGVLVLDYKLADNVQPFKLNLIYATLVNLFFHLLNTILLYFNNYKKQWKEAEELRRISTQAQLQLIKNQVNPHFLFNNLNVLSAMVIRENPDANKFIEEFAKVYRYVLSNQESELVLLKHELEVIQPYVYLLNKRFANGLIVEIDVHDRYAVRYVIPVALQMLVENAIKHNVVSVSRPLTVKIFVSRDGYLTVKNNLQPKQTTEPSLRIGLNNISKRYQLVNGSDIEIIKTDTDFEISIPLLHVN